MKTAYRLEKKNQTNQTAVYNVLMNVANEEINKLFDIVDISTIILSSYMFHNSKIKLCYTNLEKR